MPIVLFDLDGTLIDSAALYAESYLAAFAAELTEPPGFEELRARRPASERRFLLDWYGPELGDRLHRRMMEVYEARAAALLALYAGVPELLDGLRDRGVRMGVVTGKSRRAFEITCRHLALEEYFDAVVVEDDVAAPKPDPSGLYLALERMGADASGATYVGDTPMDLEAARRAGLRAASALWARARADRAAIAGKLAADVWPLHAPAELLGRIDAQPAR